MTTANECARPGTLTANKRLSEASEKRVENATEELQRYIENFTNVVQTKPAATPISRCYGSSNGSLLSTKPEPFSSAKKHSRKTRASAEKQREMADNLVEWVNESYSKDLRRKIVPFGQRGNSSVDTNRLSQTEGDGGSSDNEVSTLTDGDPQLSTLPSPGTSVVSDIDSNVGSVNTDVLLNSFYKHKRSQGKEINHPSWVEELVATKHYPSWIDEIDESDSKVHHSVNHQRNRLSRSLSPSFFRDHSSPKQTSLQPREISGPQQKKSKAWDLESTYTEALISESIYGPQPVNMGGMFHHSLYHDKRIQQLHDCSVRKFAKDSERSLIKEMSFAHIGDIKSGKQTQSLPKPRKTAHPKSKQHNRTNGELMEASKSLPDARIPRNISQDNLEHQNFRKKVNSGARRPKSLHLLNGEARKNSTDSSNTDRLMRQSPTGIEMKKQDSRSRTKSDHSSKIHDRIPTQFNHSRQVMPTPNVLPSRQDFQPPSPYKTPERGGNPKLRHARKNVHTTSPSSPRRNASEELQRIIDEAEYSEERRKDHYLTGKVSKQNLTVKHRKKTFRNDGINSWKGSKVDRSKPNNYSRNGSYVSRTDLRTISPRRLPHSHEYHRQMWDSGSHGRSPPRMKIPWNSEPTKLGVTAQTNDHNLRSRSRTKSAPAVAHHAGTFLPKRGERYGGNFKTHDSVARRDMADERDALIANYANADYANERRVLQEDLESVDTEALMIKPPMPVFDASPSLTTESAESTLGLEDGDTLIENLALRTSFLATELHSSSGTSYMEFRMSSPEMDENWEVRNPPNVRLATKPAIITAFLDDCIRSSEDSRSDIHFNNGEFPLSSIADEEESVMNEESSSERPVETLKKMLFTVQRLAHSSEEDSGQGVNDESLETQSEVLTEGVLSDILSTASHNEGQDSLSRAYFHLARLKRLVSASKEVAAWK